MQVQTNPTPVETKRAFERIGAIAEGAEVSGDVGTSETAVPHRLKRVPKGWFLISPAYGAAVPGQTKAPDDQNIYVRAATAVTGARFWVW